MNQPPEVIENEELKRKLETSAVADIPPLKKKKKNPAIPTTQRRVPPKIKYQFPFVLDRP